MVDLSDLLLLSITDVFSIFKNNIKLCYERLERLCNYLRFSHWLVASALLIMKRDTTWATWFFLIQAVRLVPKYNI